ncbi:MAG TPA: DNA mismatch repair endonuclease MutL [Candidatus Poseidoniales archaeon]|jgi:DNA mismatch repair protein MutL|nr:MAG TPA: DNA mismatch repair endonuclease MutL [Candidatus Poseidoniales archaeon]HIH57900.1 DNA mismatch repair endonuclease MutL [Candidatus Poseidoniaceae archaeon]|tara:strand:- start:7409 stop:9310 length:1902 start_codon:yes stop_codon:yes gene_type:complete
MSQPSRIKQLDERTIGHIAAGEVVERPAQVVKELIENSIDADSSRITIEIERGGFDLIRITDDGSGIHEHDLSLSLDRHATSKLSSEEDLAAIGTLGFRGEALASIGMVSKLSISSRPLGTEGRKIVMDNGNKGKIEPAGVAEGTSIEVSHIFANQPARLAFQRRPATETSKIVDVVVSHAISHPEVGFRLVSDEKTILEVPAVDEMEDRLYDVLGRQAGKMIQISEPPGDSDAPGDENWSGWISTPDITRGKGDEIHILINGRPVAAQPFLQSIRRGYRTRLMQGRHPVAVLLLDLPHDEVDVNVHPTKREVRLRNSWRVLERLERSIAYTLESTPTEPESSGGITGITSLAPQTQERRVVEKPAWAQTAQISLTGDKPIDVKQKEKPRPISKSESSQTTITGTEAIAPALSIAERELHRHAGHDTEDIDNTEPLGPIINDLPAMEPLAQFADSYILVQAEEELLLIDQHALHERIRYERLRHDESLWQAQERITPVPLDLDARQVARLEARIDDLTNIGFVIEKKAAGFSITSAPALLCASELEPFMHDILLDMSEDGAPLETIEQRKDHLAFLNSCRGAVKANEKLNLSQMRRLLDDMRRIPNPWACVHGRPTAMRIPLNALDHHFGRHG